MGGIEDASLWAIAKSGYLIFCFSIETRVYQLLKMSALQDNRKQTEDRLPRAAASASQPSGASVSWASQGLCNKLQPGPGQLVRLCP